MPPPIAMTTIVTCPAESSAVSPAAVLLVLLSLGAEQPWLHEVRPLPVTALIFLIMTTIRAVSFYSSIVRDRAPETGRDTGVGQHFRCRLTWQPFARPGARCGSFRIVKLLADTTQPITARRAQLNSRSRFSALPEALFLRRRRIRVCSFLRRSSSHPSRLIGASLPCSSRTRSRKSQKS